MASHGQPRGRKIEDIKQAVCQHFAIGKNDIEGLYRDKRMVRARHVAFWLARDMTKASHPEIGRRCGDRDHRRSTTGCGRSKPTMPLMPMTLRAVRAMLGVQHNG